jgi:hypothetical protein
MFVILLILAFPNQVQWLKPITLANWEAEIGRITVKCQPGQKFLETVISTNKTWTWWHMPVILGTQQA